VSPLVGLTGLHSGSVARITTDHDDPVNAATELDRVRTIDRLNDAEVGTSENKLFPYTRLLNRSSRFDVRRTTIGDRGLRSRRLRHGGAWERCFRASRNSCGAVARCAR
jgi:hypothetical protein